MSNIKLTLIDNTFKSKGKDINIGNIKKFIPKANTSTEQTLKPELINESVINLTVIDTDLTDIERAGNNGMDTPVTP